MTWPRVTSTYFRGVHGAGSRPGPATGPAGEHVRRAGAPGWRRRAARLAAAGPASTQIPRWLVLAPKVGR